MSKLQFLRKFILVSFLPCLFVGFFFFHLVNSVFAKDNLAEDDYQHLKLFTDVVSLIQKNYVEEVPFKNLVEGALKGMLTTLDPHSSYLNQENYKDLKVETTGEFGGLGIEITVKKGVLTVVAPIEDSPAYKAGVKAGDQIIKIEGEFAKDLTLPEAVKKMRGPRGTSVTISVYRKGQNDLIPIEVERDVIKVKSVRSRVLDEGFVYVRVSQFQEDSGDEFEQALKRLSKKVPESKIEGLVIDLRNNPGGLLTQAISISDTFLREGIIVYTDGRLESQKQKHFARDDGNEPEYPVVVLINGGSASASEIVAGALQDHGRALVLGSQSFGKGSVQTILPIDYGAALRLTTALYYTKSGRSIQAQGITPDISVSAKRYPRDSEELLEEDERKMSEKDLRGAIKNPNKKEKKERLKIGSRDAMKAEISSLLKDDPQLDEALRLLKTWSIFQEKPTIQAGVEANLTSG